MSFQPRPAEHTAADPDRREQQPIVAAVDFAQDLARLARLAQSDYLA